MQGQKCASILPFSTPPSPPPKKKNVSGDVYISITWSVGAARAPQSLPSVTFFFKLRFLELLTGRIPAEILGGEELLRHHPKMKDEVLALRRSNAEITLPQNKPQNCHEKSGHIAHVSSF